MRHENLDPQVVSRRTVSRFLNKNGLKYLQSRKKGLLYNTDLQKRLSFARDMKRRHNATFWKEGIAFYFDATGFHYKRYPLRQAQAVKGRVWRKKSEGLTFGCTSKGSKVGSGGKVVRVYAAISYDRGVVLAKPYKKLTGKKFAKFVRKQFPSVFERCARKGNERLFLQDGDPCQNSHKALRALRRINAKVLKIPPRSPDLNPIENIFKLLGDQLSKDALEKNINEESFESFQSRVVDTLLRIPTDVINKTVSSMPKRIDAIIKNKGTRLKY